MLKYVERQGRVWFYFPLRSFQQGLQTIYEIDTALIELRKVSDESADSMERFGKTATQIGIELGKTTKEVINATTEWARLGYAIEDATKLAQETLIFSNIGEISVDEATQYLVSTIKAFRKEVSETRDVLDQINEVSNNYAISAGGIGEALKRSSASMQAANNSLEETIALLAATNEMKNCPIYW